MPRRLWFNNTHSTLYPDVETALIEVEKAAEKKKLKARPEITNKKKESSTIFSKKKLSLVGNDNSDESRNIMLEVREALETLKSSYI